MNLDIFANKINVLFGCLTALFSFFFTGNGILFLFFLILNVIDCVFGYMKAYKTKTIKSGKGLEGIIKKLAYWVIVAIAFGMSEYFIDIGNILGIELSFLKLFGWFILGVYIINEITSIVENMVIMEIPVPDFFVKGLKVAKTAIDEAGNRIIPDGEKKDED